jgi:hypothetical protein
MRSIDPTENVNKKQRSEVPILEDLSTFRLSVMWLRFFDGSGCILADADPQGWHG